MTKRRIIAVSAAESGQRLDLLVVSHLVEVSRSTVQRWISSGNVRVGGEPSRANYRVRSGDVIQVKPVEPPAPDLLPEPIELDIVHEDSALLVVNKPAGMVVHPGPGNRSGTLANALAHHFERQISQAGSLRPGIVHRLDKATSGLLVVARNERVHEFLARQFKQREVGKEYLALVFGRVNRDEGQIDVGLGRDSRARTRMSTRSSRLRPAATRYEVLRRYPDFTYLRALPRTGRTHQIRVHFQHLGHPIVGDRTYSGKRVKQLQDRQLGQAVRRLGRHFLHASRLSFVHPESLREVAFEAPLPAQLEDFLKALE